MKLTGRFVCVFVFFVCLRTGVMSRQMAFDSGTRELLFGKAADTTVVPFVCPGNGNYPVPGQECTNAYYSCVSGNPVLSYCPGASVFEPTTQMCTSPSSAPCKIITTTTTTMKTSTESTSATEPLTTEAPTTAASMTTVLTTDNYDQSTTKSTLITTIKSTTTIASTESTLPTQKSTTTTSPTTTSTESTPFVCPSSNGNYPNPNNCKTFYICSNGIAYLYDCPSNLVFNPATGNCDYEENVSRPCGSAH